MAIILCESCGFSQPFYEFYRPYQRDASGRIIQENGWHFNPDTGRCISDTSDASRRNQPYARYCVSCHQRAAWVYSSEPPPLDTWVPPESRIAQHEQQAVEDGFEAEPEYVWSVRKGGKTCGCRGGRCQLRGGGIGGCGCASNGYACSVMCGCGGRGEEGSCLNPYTPPSDAPIPESKKCGCYAGCTLREIGTSCGCAAFGVGCSDSCKCGGACNNGRR